MDLDHPKSKWAQPALDLIGWMLFGFRYPLPRDPKQCDAFGYQKEISTNPLDFVGHIGGRSSHLLPGSSCVHINPAILDTCASSIWSGSHGVGAIAEVAGGPPPVRQQLRLLWQPQHARPRLQVLLQPEQAAASRCGAGTSRPVNLPVFLFGGVVVAGRSYVRGLS